MLICGTDATGGSGAPEVGTLAFTGAVFRLGNPQYVNVGGDTMTGALAITSGLTINDDLTANSGATFAGMVTFNGVNAEGFSLDLAGGALRVGGGGIFVTGGDIEVEGNALSGTLLVISDSIEGAGLTDCDIAGSSKLLWDATSKRFSCGTDQTGGSGAPEVGTLSFSGAVRIVGDTRYARLSGGNMGRGRDGPFGPPPAQIRTCGITASGSYFGYLA